MLCGTSNYNTELKLTANSSAGLSLKAPAHPIAAIAKVKTPKAMSTIAGALMFTLPKKSR